MANHGTGDLEGAITETRRKLWNEEKIYNGAKSMRTQHTNKNVIAELDSQLMESEKRIEYLQGKLKELSIMQKSRESRKSEGIGAEPGSPGGVGGRGDYRRHSALINKTELRKSSAALSTEKISLKIHEITYKLEVEKKLLEATNRMASIYTNEFMKGNKKKMTQVTETSSVLNETRNKIRLLEQGFKKYQSLFVEYVDEDTREEMFPAEVGRRRMLSGTLEIRVDAGRYLSRAPTQQKDIEPERYVKVKVDGVLKATTRLSKQSQWHDQFSISVYKASEVEFGVYEVVEHDVLVGIMWIKLADMYEELKQQQAMGGEDKKETGSGTRRMTSGVVGAAGRDTEGIQSSWDVEPYGSLELWFNFKSERTRRKEGGTEEGLGRKAAVRKRKGPCTEMYKHHFYTQQTYAITRCAICEEYLVNSEGLQCEDCQMFVHSKCVHKIVNSCLVGVSETEDADKHPDPVDIIKYRIPHRWDNTISLGANWCCHCGSMVTLGRRILKCVECSVVCHYTCSAFVPNFCGLRLYKAFDMLTQIQRSIVVKPTVLTSRNTTFRQARKPSAAAVKSLGSPDGQGFESLELNYKPLTSAIQAPVHPQQVQTVVAKLVPPVPPQELIPQKAAVTAFGSEDFRFLAVLGKGNFGKVMLAEERRTRGLYAIKILKKQFIAENDEFESTRSEKRVLLIANKTRHPFLIGLHSCFQTDTRIFFVMEYISGGDLMMHIQRQQFSERRAKFYACEVLLALEYFHQNNIIYRDLKLDNIMLGADGHIKIADYGLCKENMPYGATTHTFCGTPEFMAPEIVLEQRYGRPVDWWAFGVLIYEMLLGQSPFRGDDEEEIFDAILEDEVLYPVNMSRDSVSICQELLERDANKRLGSGPGDADDVKRHPFFRGINWTNILEKKVTPPFIPQISGPNDVSNFDTEFTSERPVLTVLKGYGQKGGVDKKQSDLEFSDFDYVAPWAGKTDKWTL